jgi:hypothetical protein
LVAIPAADADAGGALEIKATAGHVVDSHPNSADFALNRPGRAFQIGDMSEVDRRKFYNHLAS